MLVATETGKEVQAVDKALLKKRFGSAITTYDAHADVQRQMAIKLVKMAKPVLSHQQPDVLELGCGTGLLTEQIVKEFALNNYVGNDLVDEVSHLNRSILGNRIRHYDFIAGDAEMLEFPKMQDSIWSGATIQWITQLPRFFGKLSSVVKTGGYLVLSSFGPDNYHEIKSITGNGIDYQVKEQICTAAAGHFELVAFQEWQERMWFDKPADVLRHMRYTGVNSVTHCQWSKGAMQAFNLAYEAFAQTNAYPLTYHPYLMIFKKK
ncbi:malonyl-ACP O-methyltransferase BioC [Carboxylicivirga sp. RSCT41]|uniref:malonyl-ACP O-methyltransferase BioC n=1 Tax=Carboxylicivirga agarovorans TaxID=3417570 RepID=UPI003D33B1C8